jgi:hypothetical protein
VNLHLRAFIQLKKLWLLATQPGSLVGDLEHQPEFLDADQNPSSPTGISLLPTTSPRTGLPGFNWPQPN